MPPPRHQVIHAALTDTGVKRPYNQDSFAAQPAADPEHWKVTGHIFVVADGMGGHAVGEKASAKAVRDIPLTYTKHVAQDGAAAAIKRAFVEANAAIYGIGQNNPEFKGLGTTGTALFLRPDGAWVGHVGDSRAYRVRGDRVQQMTFDHSWVWEVARRQGVDPDDLGDFKKNVIIRSLGPDAEVEVDIEGPHPVEPGDLFLLCSDGLSNLVTADEIGAVLTTFPPEEACRFLIELSNLRGGPDNITCVIVQIPGEPGPAKKPPGPRKPGLLARWNKAVPWPLTALGAGVVAGALAVALKLAAGTDVALPMIGVAAVAIAAGLVGLVLHARRPAPDPDATTQSAPLRSAPDHPTVYRDYVFTLNDRLLDRFADLEGSLRDLLKGKDLTIDWATYKQYATEADTAARAGDWPAAFRARCLALNTLAVPFNKVRHKEESFRPPWMKGGEAGPEPAA